MIVHEWTAPEAPAKAVGQAYGRRWADRLAATHAEYMDHFSAVGLLPSVITEVVEGCWEATAVYAPEVATEMRGMATGSGLTESQIMVLAARTEILACKPAAAECSTVIYLPADRSAPRTLQTWDWIESLSSQALVRRGRAADGVPTVTFCEFGQPAKIGVNGRGVGVHFNILHHTSDGGGHGVPIHVLARLVLDGAASVADAVEIVRSVPRSASGMLAVAASTEDGPKAAALEIAPAGVAVLEVGHDATLAHTNHFLDPDLAVGERAPATSTTCARLACLEAAPELAAIPDARTRAEAFGAIPDAPISVLPNATLPSHERMETKLTIALDVDSARLEFMPGRPADVAADGWRTVAAAAPQHA